MFGMLSFGGAKGYDGPDTHLGHLASVMDDLQRVILRADGGIMRMYPGGPDVGLGVGAKQRGIKFIKQRDDSDEYRWATMAEQLITHYRLMPKSVIHIEDVANWMRMNGYRLSQLSEIIDDLAHEGISVVVESF